MASEQTPEAKELALVGKVEMRIALASSEKKLEDLLKVYLSPLLLKLGSDSLAVRNKVPWLPVRPRVWPFLIAHRCSRSSPFASTSTLALNHSTYFVSSKARID
jgi:hypothetical protein